jgi:hypothetical protein
VGASHGESFPSALGVLLTFGIFEKKDEYMASDESLSLSLSSLSLFSLSLSELDV